MEKVFHSSSSSTLTFDCGACRLWIIEFNSQRKHFHKKNRIELSEALGLLFLLLLLLPFHFR